MALFPNVFRSRKPEGQPASLFDRALRHLSAYRFELWKLVAWDKLLYFDAADLIFLRNASEMLESSQPFSSIRVPWNAKKPRCWPTPG